MNAIYTAWWFLVDLFWQAKHRVTGRHKIKGAKQIKELPAAVEDDPALHTCPRCWRNTAYFEAGLMSCMNADCKPGKISFNDS